jgi:hypothetical protein
MKQGWILVFADAIETGKQSYQTPATGNRRSLQVGDALYLSHNGFVTHEAFISEINLWDATVIVMTPAKAVTPYPTREIGRPYAPITRATALRAKAATV